MAMEYVDVEIDEAVATVTLDRPAVRNAISEALATDLEDAIERSRDADARCLVLTGAGDAFCSGGDVEAMVQNQQREHSYEDRRARVERSVTRAVAALYTCPIPVVAKVDGAAYGAGAGLLLACDVQLARPDARVGFGFRRVGLAVDSGVSHLLPRYVGLNTAKELVFTGELLDADRARELGLFTRLFERASFEAGVESIVDTVAGGPTAALATSKRLLNDRQDSLQAATAAEARAQAVLLDSADHAEGAAAFLEGRDPDFECR
jgi:enoyl-CoA hydratase/carnithine racemase